MKNIEKNIKAISRRKKSNAFNLRNFLDSVGVTRNVARFQAKDIIFSQGEACKDVLYIQSGSVRLSVVSKAGRKVVVAILKAGDFVGEGSLAGQPVHIATAAAVTDASVLVISLKDMIRILHAEHAFSDRFITYMLERNIRIQDDLIHQLFNSSEKRLARTLLLLARYGKRDKPQSILLKISQTKLANMIGITRSQVAFFIDKFEKLGFIKNGGRLQVNESLLNVVLHD